MIYHSTPPGSPYPRSKPFLLRPTRLTLILALTSIAIYLSLTLASFSSTSPSHTSIIQRIHWSQVISANRGGPRLRYVDGVAYVDHLGTSGRHPMEELIERGKEKAEALERKKAGIKTLDDAVEDYRREYGMEPPEGFDTWYELAISLDVPAVPALYTLAVTSVLPFLSLPPHLLRQRAKEVIEKRGIFGFEYRPELEANHTTVIGLDGITRFKTLQFEWADLTDPDVGYLPPNQNPDDPMMLPVWVDDVSHHTPSGKILGRSRELARAGKVWEEADLTAMEAEEEVKQGWGTACTPEINRNVGERAVSANEMRHATLSSFVDDPLEYADPCTHHEHLKQNGELLMKEEWTVRGLIPLTSLNSPIGGGEIIGPTTVGRKAIAPYMPWSKKTVPRVWWRGNANSAFIYDKWDWRASQRFRLSEMASGFKEHEAYSERQLSPVLLDDANGARREWRENDGLRRTYLNISLIDAVKRWPCGAHYAPFFYCDNPDGIPRPNCPMKLEECYQLLEEEYVFTQRDGSKAYENQHKFRIDIDGFGWTTRFREELSKNNVVIKITLYPEWWHPQAIPWYHYIPGRYDFTDLYDIMSFFTGSPEEHAGNITEERKIILEERDKMAERIAEQGREFAIARLGWTDMRVYMFLLLLEYRRAWSDDRVAATFRFPTLG